MRHKVCERLSFTEEQQWLSRSPNIKGDCFLVKMSKNGTFEDVTENELELMKNIVANNISEICKMLK